MEASEADEVLKLSAASKSPLLVATDSLARPRSAQQRLETASAAWQAADVAYLLNAPVPQCAAEVEELARRLDLWLASCDGDLLAQLTELVAETGHATRLSFFEWALHERFDALSMPRSGNVGIESFFPPDRELSSVKRQEIDPAILEKTLGARSAMAEAFEGYEERAEQLSMAAAVESALSLGRSLVVEAGTGVGKSLGYLVPLAIHAARSGKLCLVSTNTLNLQQQLVDLDIPRLRRILSMLDLRVTLLKGREHYLCLKRLQETWLADHSQASSKRSALHQGSLPGLLFMLRMLIQCSEAPEGDLDSLPTPKGLGAAQQSALLRSIDCGFKTCLGERCEFKPRCHFFTRRAAANVSHMVIGNHALVFSLFSPDQQDKDNVVSRADVIVFDEAHNLESAISNQMTFEFAHPTMVDLGNRLLDILESPACARRLDLPASSIGEEYRERYERCQQARRQLPQWIRVGIEVREQVNQLLVQAEQKNFISRASRNQLSLETVSENQHRLIELLGKLALRLSGVVEKYYLLAYDLFELFCNDEGSLYIDDADFQMNAQALRFDTMSALGALQNWKPGDKSYITWFNCSFEDEGPAWEFKAAPLNVGEIYQQLARSKESVILSSATLTVADSFGYLKESLGFDEPAAERSEWLKLSSPFTYDTQSMLLVATDMPSPTGASRDAYLIKMEELLHGVQDIFKGGILVLFNSYRDLNHIADALALSFTPGELLVQGVSGTRAEIAAEFRERGDRILLATRSFWEGFDVAGDALRCVVLAKLPFANIGDPIHAGRQRAIDEAGGDSFRQYSLPLAAMLLKQGFGRLIRSTRDHGCVFLLDSRVVTARYGKVFLDSLPGPRTFSGSSAQCLETAREFMAAHRSALEQQNA